MAGGRRCSGRGSDGRRACCEVSVIYSRRGTSRVGGGVVRCLHRLSGVLLHGLRVGSISNNGIGVHTRLSAGAGGGRLIRRVVARINGRRSVVSAN